ncbi:thioredoxin [Clostridium bovifaecis]|uniref:Thioredoxin n=1 Tax=Clostridium bovifaecis TaxID=2184719 RepID=A0A6I6FD65_9CLOT|nr:thioredoxin [Clostridium bovifaecis]
MVKNIMNQALLDKEIKDDIHVVVDFWASFCNPCRMLEPVFEEAARELEGKAKFIKMNIFDHEEVSRRFQITTVPAVFIFKNGEVIDKSVGFKPKEVMIKWIEENLI